LVGCTAQGQHEPPLYMDPTLYDDVTAISRTSDIYPFGIQAWQLITEQTPFEEVLERIGHGWTFEDAVRAGARPPVSVLGPLLPAGVVEDVTTVLEACWDADRGVRPTAEDVNTELQGVLDRREGESARSAVAPVSSNTRIATTTHPEDVSQASAVMPAVGGGVFCCLTGIQDAGLEGHGSL
jgi:hypothetical protein